MSIAALASGIWHAATTVLTTPQARTASFTPDEPRKPAAPGPGEAGTSDPARQKMLSDLQSWINTQQQQQRAPADPARVRNAYAGASACAGAG